MSKCTCTLRQSSLLVVSSAMLTCLQPTKAAHSLPSASCVSIADQLAWKFGAL